MHIGHPRKRASLGAGALMVHVAVFAACGHREVQVSVEHCAGLPAPACVCAQRAQNPVCVGTDWDCPPCIVEPRDAAIPDIAPESPPHADAMPAIDLGGTRDVDAGDGGEGCGDGDGSGLVCRKGCGDRAHEWRPACEGTRWRCHWGGALEDRSIPAPACDGGN